MAGTVGAGWLEAESGPPTGHQADLLIVLDGPCPGQSPDTPIPCKSWVLGTDWQKRLEERIAGMVGGFRLMARLDQSPPPGRGKNSLSGD